MQKKIFLTLVTILTLLVGIDIASAQLQIPGADKLQGVSIQSSNIWNDSKVTIETARDFGGSLLGIAKTIISGFALIYIVLMGLYMVIYSDDEGELKKQKTQIIYVILGFVFLNIPSAIYQLFMRTDNRSIPTDTSWGAVTQSSSFWNLGGTFGFNWFLGDIIWFLKVIAFIAAVIMFTWGAFALILSRGKDEYREQATNRLVYGIMGLLFLGIVEVWARLATSVNLQEEITNVAGSVFGAALFFAAPVAIFFIMVGAYYYITSGGDEERAKKWKTILFHTFIATLILIASFSFLQEFVAFLK